MLEALWCVFRIFLTFYSFRWQISPITPFLHLRSFPTRQLKSDSIKASLYIISVWWRSDFTILICIEKQSFMSQMKESLIFNQLLHSSNFLTSTHLHRPMSVQRVYRHSAFTCISMFLQSALMIWPWPAEKRLQPNDQARRSICFNKTLNLNESNFKTFSSGFGLYWTSFNSRQTTIRDETFNLCQYYLIPCS